MVRVRGHDDEIWGMVAVAAGTGGADGQCPPKTNCKNKDNNKYKNRYIIVYSNI
jgi:hypothetical protein